MTIPPPAVITQGSRTNIRSMFSPRIFSLQNIRLKPIGVSMVLYFSLLIQSWFFHISDAQLFMSLKYFKQIKTSKPVGCKFLMVSLSSCLCGLPLYSLHYRLWTHLSLKHALLTSGYLFPFPRTLIPTPLFPVDSTWPLNHHWRFSINKVLDSFGQH